MHFFTPLPFLNPEIVSFYRLLLSRLLSSQMASGLYSPQPVSAIPLSLPGRTREDL